jgi:hypothetical protein
LSGKDASPEAPVDATSFDAGFEASSDAESDRAVSHDAPTVDAPGDVASEQASGDPYEALHAAIDPARLVARLQEMSGYADISTDAGTSRITERYSPSSKQKFRDYWSRYFQSLGASPEELAYPTQHTIGESEGHNLEVVIPGRSADCVVVIAHYDSIGPEGHETENPAVDDDMTGMSSMLEAARLFIPLRTRLLHTLRFVAADYEEQANPGLEGSRHYAQALAQQAKDAGFSILAAIDYEQSGWNCGSDGLCGSDIAGKVADVIDCSGDANAYSSPDLGAAARAAMQTYSRLSPSPACMTAYSDHYPMWEIGVPAVVISEHDPLHNPHFDQKGGDTFDRIDVDYFVEIAKTDIMLTAKVVGIASE